MRKSNRKIKVVISGWPIHLDSLAEIPWNFASKSEWRRRGYKVARGQKPAAEIFECSTKRSDSLALYRFLDVEYINGKKAAQRRDEFDAIIGPW